MFGVVEITVTLLHKPGPEERHQKYLKRRTFKKIKYFGLQLTSEVWTLILLYSKPNFTHPNAFWVQYHFSKRVEKQE